jgi:hypothetical protein
MANTGKVGAVAAAPATEASTPTVQSVASLADRTRPAAYCHGSGFRRAALCRRRELAPALTEQRPPIPIVKCRLGFIGE